MQTGKKGEMNKKREMAGGENVTRELLWKQETGNKGPFPLLPLSFVTCRGKKRKRFCLFPQLVAVLNMRRPHKPLADHMLITGVMGITFQRPREKILVTQTGGPHLALLFEKNGDDCGWLETAVICINEIMQIVFKFRSMLRQIAEWVIEMKKMWNALKGANYQVKDRLFSFVNRPFRAVCLLFH
jgi:hypothetical protein